MEYRSQSLNNFELKFESDNTFSGYASTFDNVDSYGDTILKGAYTETLKNHGVPKMLLQHDSHALPIGKWINVSEDSKGLHVTGEFTKGMAVAEDAKAALQHGTVDGLSIGFMLRKGDYKQSDKAENGRIIEKVSMLREISVVTFPADSYARIDLKSEIEEIETIRDFEYFLRDAGSLSNSSVKMLISKAKTIFRDEKEEITPDLSEIVKRLTKISS
jgi:HK97 family phage prohead protease